MAIDVATVTPATIEQDGGAELIITGTFPVNTPLSVHIGPTGDGTDERAVSGKCGRMYTPVAASATRLKVFAPELPVGGPYKIFITDGVTDDVLLAALTVVKRSYRSSSFQLKRSLPPHWKLGPRGTDVLEPV